MMETPAIGSTIYANALSQSAGFLNSPDWAAYAAKQQAATLNLNPPVYKKEPVMADFNTRLVKVFIVDPNANLPLANRLLYQGDEKLTDLTDQELFFEVDINGLLAKHNEVRTKTEDKKANKDKPVYLEAARVRDLKMQVVVLAQF